MIKEMPLLVFFGSYIDSFVKLALIISLIGQKKFYRLPKFWIATILLNIYVFFSYLITDNFFRILMLLVLTILMSIFTADKEKRNVFKIVITSFFVWVFLVLFDILSNIIVTGILNIDINAYRDDYLFVVLMNCLIFLGLTALFSFKSIRKMVYRVSSVNIKDSKNYIIMILIISSILFSIIFYLCIFNYNHIQILIVSFIMVVIYTIISIVTINTFNQKNKLKSEYEVLLTNLNEYENLLERQRIMNHENKNQLLAIKGLMSNKNSASEYIDTLLDTEYVDVDNLISKTNRIPSGGLKGLIYYKMLLMKSKKIDVNLEVNNSSKDKYLNIEAKVNQELCKIVGVFLDNAIEEVESLNEKHINIIYSSLGDYMIIKISNNYINSSFDKIGEKGYTTKGRGHGYGLKLVDEIVKHNSLFIHNMEINGNVFSQIIKLKIK